MLNLACHLCATTIYDNGSPNRADGADISGFIAADDFTVSAGNANVTSVTFWSSANCDPYPSQFSGTIGWGIFADAGGTPGTLLFSGANNTPVLTDTGLQIFGTDEWGVQFSLPSIPLTSGIYWLGLHEGAFGTPDDGTEIYWDTTGSQTGALSMSTTDLTGSSGWFTTGLDSGSGSDLAFQISATTNQTSVPEPPAEGILAVVFIAAIFYYWLRSQRKHDQFFPLLRIYRCLFGMVCFLPFAPCARSQCSYSVSFAGPTSFPAYGSLPSPPGSAPIEPITVTVMATPAGAYYCPGPAGFGGSNGFYIANITFGPSSGYSWTEIVTLYLLNNPSPGPRSPILTVGINDGPNLIDSQAYFQEGTAGLLPDANATTVQSKKQGGNQHFPCPGMTGYSFNSLLISLNLVDTPISYTPPKGPPIAFTATYNQKEANQPATFTYSNLGQDWSFNWLSYVTTTSGSPTTVYARGGGTETFLSYVNGGVVEYAPEQNTGAVLVQLSSNSFEKVYPDGSIDVFSQLGPSTSTTKLIFLTSVVDPQGNAATLTYDSQSRILAVTDAIGHKMTFTYGLSNDPYKVTQVSDAFGRSAVLSYDPSGRLISIQDAIGMVSSYTYGTGNFINSLNTPYGTTNFVYGESATNQWLMATDPLGQTERIEYRDKAPGIAASDPAVPSGMSIVNANLNVSNTFYWDKKAYADAPGDYTKAVMTHWMAGEDVVSALPHSIKMPLESRVFYNYQNGPANPGATVVAPDTLSALTAVGRLLDDGSTQLTKTSYNSIGKPLQTVDPLGRQTNLSYAGNSIDLVETTQTNGTKNDVLFLAAYNAQHLPLTTTDAAGQTTVFTYNTAGQPLTVKNPKNETTTFAYDPNGYFQTVTGAIPGSTTSFTYDNVGRVAAITDSEGYVVANAYDNLNRPTTQTFPDGTSRTTVYDRMSVGSVTDRLRRTTTYTNDALGRVVSIKDPLGRITNQTWCKCGAPATLQDPKGNTTTWTRDIEGRATAKTYADGKGDTFVYENTTSRLHSQTDALTQAKTFGYLADNNIASIAYTNAINPTPNVSFSYDPIYNRRTSMVDGTGTTAYVYYPVNGQLGAGKLDSVVGPIANSTITYTYDQLGRRISRSINGAANQLSDTFDSLGRVTSETNSLGTFATTYVDQTSRPSNVTYPNGQTVAYSYFNNLGDERLKQISNQAAGKVLSEFDYAYDAEGQITTWNQPDGDGTYALNYDAAGQLTAASLTGATPKSYLYSYDPAANRTNEIINGASAPASANIVNELVSRSGSSARSFAYDADGDMISNSGTTRSSTNYTYQWDAENRPVSISYSPGGQQTLFTYDGLGRRVKIVEKTAGAITAMRQFVWDGLSIAEERDASANLVKRFYSEGQINGSTAYFYTRDHLGSIREVVNTSDAMVARYDYDPYGRRSTILGSDVADFGVTGHFYHAPSGLHLAPFRAYSGDLGRWLSRDPLSNNAEFADTSNLFAYVRNSPFIYHDKSGLQAIQVIPEIDPDYEGEDNRSRREAFENAPDVDDDFGFGIGAYLRQVWDSWFDVPQSAQEAARQKFEYSHRRCSPETNELYFLPANPYDLEVPSVPDRRFTPLQPAIPLMPVLPDNLDQFKNYV